MQSVLLITDEKPGDPSGRADKFDKRRQMLRAHGWNLVFSFVPKPYVLSFVWSIWKSFRIARRADVDVVISVNNPFHLHLIGFFTSRLMSTPWIAEFRDPLVTNPDVTPGSWQAHIRKLIEAFVVRFADRVVWIDGIQLENDYFKTTYPHIADSKWEKLPFIGFLEHQFEAVEPRPSEKFTIIYAGSFYEDWLEPLAFFDGLKRYVSEYDTGLNVTFYGGWHEQYDARVDDIGIQDYVETNGFVSHEKLVPELMSADVGLYIGGDDPRNRLNVSSKLWDYLGARLPILGIADSSFRVADFIESNGFGLVAEPSDPRDIADTIHRLRSGRFEHDPQSNRDEYTRERHLEAYASILTDVAEEGLHS